MSLIDLLAYRMGCTYISDLKNAAAQGDGPRLLHAITNTRAEDHPLREWNDMLDYLFSAPAEGSAKDARMKAISLLIRRPPAPYREATKARQLCRI